MSENNDVSVYQKRREVIYDWMAREGIAVAVIEDFEGKRDPSLRRLSGHPGDALLLLAVDRKCLLIPGDINMAKIYADAEAIVPFSEFDRSNMKALKAATGYFKTPKGSRLEIPGTTSYPRFLEYVEEISDFDIICRNNGLATVLENARAIKDEEEIAVYAEVFAKTREVIDLIEKNIKKGKIKTELDAALFIESEGRKLDCEGTGFETIAAGPERSFGIHAFPAYTCAPFATKGLSILDFGLKYRGYTSDVTLTVARGPLSRKQEKMISLVEKAYKLAQAACAPGKSVRDIALAVDGFFAKSKVFMPHALGHGIGVEAHEAPTLRTRATAETVLLPGMIFTQEPGLYDPEAGGCRLENDFLVTANGIETPTDSHIIYL